MEYADTSDSKVLPAGNYSIVGGFYSPSHQVSNKLDNDGIMHPGWLGYYESEFSKNGFDILSKYNFNYNTCSYCEGEFWPDNKTGEHIDYF